MKPITGTTCERAWLEAAEHLAAASSHNEYNLIVEILDPTAHDDGDRRVRKVADDFLRQHDANPVSTVAGTIFPSAEYQSFGRRGVYEVYPDEVFPEIMGPREWGRYAHRLVRWPARRPSEKDLNPLETLVGKMKKQLAGPRMRACYELSLTDSAIDLPLYDPLQDKLRPRNGPCLSHVSFKIGAGEELYLTALYRSHSYVSRALGNFLGLAALQAFVCDETGLSPGPLVCVSSYARLETDGGWSLSAGLEMVKQARAALGVGAPHEAA
jgi:hypothetical protein